MKRWLMSTVVCSALIAAFPSIAADPVAGKAKYAVCAGCHGPAGMGNAALGYPQLAGRDAAFVMAQLQAFKSGKRESATMKAMVAGLSGTDMENLGAYIASLR